MTDFASQFAYVESRVREELEWVDGLDDSSIAVHELAPGLVALRGRVPSSSERAEAVRAAYRVRGVTTLLDELSTDGDPPLDRVEGERIARAVHALVGAASMPETEVRGHVHGDLVVLTGEVARDSERARLQTAVERIPGVRRADNRVCLVRRPSAADTGERIRNALVRLAILDAAHIRVSAVGTRVTLTGAVPTWDERHQAEVTAWSSPHVTDVDNQIVVVPRE